MKPTMFCFNLQNPRKVHNVSADRDEHDHVAHTVLLFQLNLIDFLTTHQAKDDTE